MDSHIKVLKFYGRKFLKSLYTRISSLYQTYSPLRWTFAQILRFQPKEGKFCLLNQTQLFFKRNNPSREAQNKERSVLEGYRSEFEKQCREVSQGQRTRFRLGHNDLNTWLLRIWDLYSFKEPTRNTICTTADSLTCAFHVETAINNSFSPRFPSPNSFCWFTAPRQVSGGK